MQDYQLVGLIGGVGALALVLSSLAARRMESGLVIRYALLWVGLFGLGYAGFRLLGID